MEEFAYIAGIVLEEFRLFGMIINAAIAKKLIVITKNIVILLVFEVPFFQPEVD